jgi:hypothetical protein
MFGVSGSAAAGGADRRAARPEGARPAGPGQDALHAGRLGGGAHRALPRPPRLPVADDAGPHRRPRRPGRSADRPDRGAARPVADQVEQLDEIPGVGRIGAQELIAEIGVELGRFPSAGHLVSWAKFAPTTNASAGKTKSSSTGKGNPWIGATIGEAAMGASKTKTFLGSRYRRIVKRRGKQRALVAVGNPGPHRRLPLAVGPAGPLRRPRRRLPRPPAPPTPSPSTDPRTRTPLRQEGGPPHGRLTTQTGVVTVASSRHEPGSAGRSRLPPHHPIFEAASARPWARLGPDRVATLGGQ